MDPNLAALYAKIDIYEEALKEIANGLMDVGAAKIAIWALDRVKATEAANGKKKA